MIADQTLSEKAAALDALAMQYETAVTIFPAADYAAEFCRFFEVKAHGLKLIPSPNGFYDALKEVSGDDVWQPIAQKTEVLFGLPKRVTVFENDAAIRNALEGDDGMGPFCFIFDLMFCEYDSFTLCFISGTNN